MTTGPNPRPTRAAVLLAAAAGPSATTAAVPRANGGGSSCVRAAKSLALPNQVELNTGGLGEARMSKSGSQWDVRVSNQSAGATGTIDVEGVVGRNA